MMIRRCLAAVFVALLLACPAFGESDAELVTRGYEAFSRHDYETALTCFKKALTIYHDPADQALILYGMASCHYARNDVVACVETLDRSLVLYRQVHDKKGVNRVLEALVKTYGEQAAIFAKSHDAAAESGYRLLLADRLSALQRSEEAAREAGLAVTLRRGLGKPVPLGVALAQHAYFLSEIGRNEEAVRDDLEAVKLLHDAGDKVGEATTLSNLGGLYHTMGRREEALDVLGRARRLHRELGRPAREMANVSSLASILHALGRWEEALAMWRDALVIARALKDRGRERAFLSDIGTTLDDLGRRGEAEKTLKEALVIARELKAAEGLAYTLINLGAVHNHIGRKEEALREFQEALDLVPDSEAGAVAASNIGEIYAQLERWDDARRFYEQAAARFRVLRLEDREMVTQLDLAAMLDGQKRWKEALAIYESLRPRMQKPTMTSDLASLLNNIAAIEGSQGKTAEALRDYQASLLLLERLGRRDAAAVTARNIAFVHENANHLEEARRMYEKAVSALHAVRNVAVEGQTIFDLGRVLYKLGKKDDALQRFARAIDLTEDVAAGFHAFKADYMATAATRYAYTVAVFFDASHVAEAFGYAERGRARAFLDALGGTHVDLRKGLPEALVKREAELLAQLERLRKRADRGEASDADLDALEKLRTEYVQVLQQIALLSPESASLRAVQTVSLDALRKTLDPDTVLIAYFLGNHYTYAWAVTREGLQAERMAGGSEAVKEAVETERDMLRNPATSGPLKAIGPLQPVVAFFEKHAAGHKTVILVPHAALHYLPFGPLADSKGGFLADRWSIVTAPSASAWYYLRQRRESGQATGLIAFALGSATPKAGTFTMRDDLGPLPGTLTEAQGIRAVYGTGARAFVEADCNRATVTVANARWLHFATHGILDGRVPWFSALALADGFFTVKDIMELDLHARLVCLSACDTARGHLSEGDEVVGLTRAFLHAGAHTVVASLWKVPDASTSALMQAFYRSMHGGKSPAEALRAAQAEVRAKWPSPLYWGAFVVYGDGTD